MASVSDEKRLSDALQKGLDHLSLSPALVVMDFMRRDTNMQSRMMDLVMSFLNTWSERYSSGMYREGEGMHRIGEQASIMLGALNATSGGKHAHVSTPSRRRGPGRLP